ncbi:DNA internalization-related competence protein ComEC/Rec2 [Staphylococcus equorum]|uniref:DNA internalization-related competence protein ComEC/Rec2 n=1 Tax=Staphylococcus equorum TaxID=246432 RepID=A0A9X4R0V9_9STAP|nr:DNA internalization-related competence protein ComEC/Rec2 [Staphylococcus equorum]MDG0842585.1 DNA internalization-related competence protein ComEC/Rec2 [Staphylococcus equorum]MDG0858284.1 DNA internalization-related competence protein ComEC/Rec2 [Staphylococcus equorum]
MFQSDLVSENKARGAYLNQNIEVDVQFVTKPILKHQKLQGKAKIDNKNYNYYFYVNNNMHSNKYIDLYQKTCNVKAKLKPLNQSPYSPISLFINSINFESCRLKNSNYNAILDRHKQYIFERLRHTKISHPEKVIALISGDTSKINNNELDKFKEIGIYHLLAVSGTHIAAIIGILIYVLNIFKCPFAYIKMVLFIFLPIYAFYTDLAPSAVRSILAALIIILIPKTIIKNSMNVLALLFIILTIIYPAYVYNIGFQFSFLITFCILFSLPLITQASPVKSLLIITVIAQLGSFMISAINFNQIQWIGFLANLIFVPFYTIILFPLVILFFILNHFPFEIIPLTYLLNFILNLHDYILKLFLYLSSYKWYIPELNDLYITLGFAFLLACVILFAHQFYSLFICSFVLLYIVVTVLPLSNDYKLTMLDVGQGDSILFETNKQESLLIDTGGKLLQEGESNQHNISKFHILPTLKKHGIKKIDYLIVTHPHIDHMGELNFLIEKYPIRNIIINKSSYYLKELKSLAILCKSFNIKLLDFKSIQSFALNKAKIKLLDATITRSNDLNEQSIITLIEYDKFKILLMGDASKNNEQLLLNKYQIENIDILKVGHHGSKTSSSSSFINVLQPKISLISVGQNNRYKLPNEEIIERLKSINSQILQTSENGEISITLNSNSGLSANLNQ